MDTPAILALNHAHETETSPMDAQAFAAYAAMAFHLGLADQGRDGFLIALDQDAPYDNANFAWFAARHARFVYVDRIIVSAAARGKGVARRLYSDLAEAARIAGHTVIGCEINLDPPNPASMAVHQALGFVTVGSQTLPNGKTVAYLEWAIG